MKWAVIVVTLGAGLYAMHLNDVKAGAALIALACLLIDPSDVIAAVKAWKGGAS